MKWLGFFIFLIFFSALPLTANAAKTCDSIKDFKPYVRIKLTVADPYYVHNMTQAELTAGSVDTTKRWLAENNMEELWSVKEMNTLGLASGGWAYTQKATAMAKPVDRYGGYWCPYFKELELEFFYRTMIQIPKEYPQGSCAYDRINEHELRHHEANKAAVEKYIQKLQDDMPILISEMERDYVRRAQVDQRFENMKLGLGDMVRIYTQEAMMAEMKKLNAAIDTVEEYEGSGQMLADCAEIDRNR